MICRRSFLCSMICLVRGHRLMPALPIFPVSCTTCGKVWDWVDLFQGRAPVCRRAATQRAYDDLEPRPSAPIYP